MKIVACCRAYNEEIRIAKFCDAFQFADLVLVADGGSTDRTVEIAQSMPKTLIRNFPLKVEVGGGIWRNPDGPHLQFLYDWAIEEGADWTICQDCDQRPNKYLKQDARDIFSKMGDKDFLMVTQIYLYGKDQYFPNLSAGWQQGLWAWRSNINLKVIDKMPHFEFSFDGMKSFDVPSLNRHVAIDPPYCFLHFGWEDEAMIEKHIEYYHTTKLIPGMRHPKSFGGQPEHILEWMAE